MQFREFRRTATNIVRFLPRDSRMCMSTAPSSSSSNSAPTIRLRDFPAHLNVATNVALPISLATANQKEITEYKIGLCIKKFQMHVTDSGSAAVQIAVATEKILNMARHSAMHKKDKHSNRGFQMMVARRKKMMIYLKRTDLQKFKETVIALKLEREASHL